MLSYFLFIYLPLPTHPCPPAPVILRTLPCFLIQLAGTSVENREREMSEGGYRADQADSSSFVELAPSQSGSQRHRKRKP